MKCLSDDRLAHICASASTPVAGITTLTGYLYDADGTRVAKGTVVTVQSLVGPDNPYGMSCDPTINGFQTNSDYVIGPGGEQLTEMGSDGKGGMTWAHTNVWAAGQLIATFDKDDTAGPHYMLNDWLGSRRVQTNALGVYEQSCQSLPYGDGLNCTNSTTTPTEHHFTGKERDAETGNDYFGARYYASSVGRWLSPDWSAKVAPVPYATLDVPPSLNLYSFVRNNPISRVDVDGHWESWQHDTLTRFAYARAHMTLNKGVMEADAARDTGGHNGLRAWGLHAIDSYHEQMDANSQPNHFLRDSHWSQQKAYNEGLKRLGEYATAAHNAQLAGDTKAYEKALGNALHLIQDSYAHTTRENGNGAITHIQCYNCSGADDDHHHPDFQVVATGGPLSPQAEGAVDASASFLTFINSSSGKSSSSFQQGLQTYEGQYLKSNLQK